MGGDKMIALYDATLREGAQGARSAFSVQDKLRVLHQLDALGVAYIEGGNPGSNPKDEAFYRQAKSVALRHAKLAAFGATCRVGLSPDQDANLKALLAADTPVVTIFGKSSRFQVQQILRCTLQENLQIIQDSVAYLKAQGREVVFDAEHFFDGYALDPDYALEALLAAQRGGCDWVCLCDTNGGSFPHQIAQAVQAAAAKLNVPLGIHCHNDTGVAVANSISAVRCGAAMVQATLNGCGERCGNANLGTLAADLELKLGYRCLPEGHLRQLKYRTQRYAEIVNHATDPQAPYVGRYAFAHKAGMHIDAVNKDPRSFEHVPPESVGAERSFLLSEVAGRVAILGKVQHLLPGMGKDAPEVQRILDALKQLEFEGYQFEGAEASFELLVRRLTGQYRPFFELKGFQVITHSPAEAEESATAIVDIVVDGRREVTAAHGNGPINALDAAARKALEVFYPELRTMQLIDFKVRALDSRQATSSKVRVVVESSDEEGTWATVGVSGDIIQASWIGLIDSLEYKLLRHREGAGAPADGDKAAV